MDFVFSLLRFRGAQRRQKRSVKILAISYGRIQGALANLGYKVSMTTVGNILRAQGIVPSPERGTLLKAGSG